MFKKLYLKMSLFYIPYVINDKNQYLYCTLSLFKKNPTGMWEH